MKEKRNVPVSAAMIVKNEEKLLAAAIESAQGIMGIKDIVVADTGSDDNTKEIAKSCGARVFDFEWVDDFSAARNFAAFNAENDWILVLDADEQITEADTDKTLKLIDCNECLGSVRVDEMLDNSRHSQTRLYNKTTHQYLYSIHENIRPFTGFTSKKINIPILIKHYGYTQEVWQEKGKYERNVKMLEEELRKKPDDPYTLYQLGKCNFAYNYDLEKACEYFEQVLLKCEDIQTSYFYSAVECYGYALINTGKYREALNLLEVYYSQYLDNPNFRFLAGHILQNNGKLIEAVECYQSCIGADMTDTKGITTFLPMYNIGVILECLDMIDDAVEMYKNCGDYEPALARLRELGRS